MDIEVIANGTIQFTRKVSHKILSSNKNNDAFRIPLSKRKLINYEEESSSDNDDDSSDSFQAMDEEIDEEDRIESLNNNSSENGSNSGSYSQRKLLRKYGAADTQEEKLLYMLSNTKKPKKELTEEEIAKKTEQMRIRKLHAKKMLEEEKREAVERILNEDGKKLRERQKKLNEDMIKKTQAREEKYKFSLTKIKHKYLKDGTAYVRFPQGLLLPTVLLQKKRELKETPKCEVEGCKNLKRYTDPLTKKHYCSVNCFKKIRENVEM